MAKLEEQIFNYLKQKGKRNEIFSGNRAIEPHGIASPKQAIDPTSLNEESPYNIERGDSVLGLLLVLKICPILILLEKQMIENY